MEKYRTDTIGTQANRLSQGGGIYVAGGSLTVTNCTITGNLSNEAGPANLNGAGIFVAATANLSINNSIIVGNIAGTAANDLHVLTATGGATRTNADNLIGVGTGTGISAIVVSGGTASTIFVGYQTPDAANTAGGASFNVANWNLRLSSTASAAIGAGNIAHISDSTGKFALLDIAGNARVDFTAGNNISLDIGAYQTGTINTADWVQVASQGVGFTNGELFWETTGENRRLAEILVANDSITDLDLTGLSGLGNADLTNCTALETLNVTGTALKFSTLSLPESIVSITGTAEMAVSGDTAFRLVWDLSSEHGSKVNVGETTEYKWFYADGKEVESDLYTEEEDGVFTFHGLDGGEKIYCVMTNEEAYGDMVLKTQEITVPERLAAPTLIDLDGHGADNLVIYWYGDDQAAEYLIQWSENGENWNEGKTVEADDRLLYSAVISDLQAETPYFIRIMALPATESDTNAISKWSEITYTTSYKVRYRPTTEDKEPGGNTKYEFRLTANYEGTEFLKSSDKIETQVWTLLPTLQNLKSTGKTANSVSLSWDSVEGADDYEIQ